MTLFVVCSVTGAQGQKVGAPKEEIAVEVGDRAQEAFESARRAAVTEFAARHGVKPPQVLVLGVF